ncbi:MAG TPA: enoyl-CoA hydratase-related protein [Gemmatimonadaceae bacterium]|nr:enoyl-CoA hydratase-related protein [Gemmatimonadaceae bacterium]
MPYDTIEVAVADRIATVTVNRPDKLNALNVAVFDDLSLLIDELRDRADVGGVIVTGAGRAFVAGADIAELEPHGALAAKALARRGQLVFNRLESLPKPVIAAVNGFALGGGCELAMACHLRIAGDGAKFGQPEVKLGLIPGYGGTQRLPRLVGKGRALQLLMTGEIIDAAEALRIGLVNKVVPAADLMKTATEMMRGMLANAPLALAGCIEMVNRGYDVSMGDALAMEATAFGLLAATEDKREGTRAFLEKRPATFKGA